MEIFSVSRKWKEFPGRVGEPETVESVLQEGVVDGAEVQKLYEQAAGRLEAVLLLPQLVHKDPGQGSEELREHNGESAENNQG